MCTYHTCDITVYFWKPHFLYLGRIANRITNALYIRVLYIFVQFSEIYSAVTETLILLRCHEYNICILFKMKYLKKEAKYIGHLKTMLTT